MTEKQKKILKLSIAFSVAFAVYPTVNAMHIMEGYLPAGYCIAWGVVCLPFLVKGFLPYAGCFRKTERQSLCWPWRALTYLSCPHLKFLPSQEAVPI